MMLMTGRGVGRRVALSRPSTSSYLKKILFFRAHTFELWLQLSVFICHGKYCVFLKTACSGKLHVPEHCMILNTAWSWILHVPEQCMSVYTACSWTVHVPEQCMFLNSVCSWTVHVPEQCTFMNTAHVPEQCMLLNSACSWTAASSVWRVNHVTIPYPKNVNYWLNWSEVKSCPPPPPAWARPFCLLG